MVVYLCGKPNEGKTTMRITSQYRVITILNTIGSLLKGSLPKISSLQITKSYYLQKGLIVQWRVTTYRNKGLI